MRFLIDNALPHVVAALLVEAGHDAIHVRDVELHRAPDSDVFDRAARDDRVLVSADTDFGTLLAARSSRRPSVVCFDMASNVGRSARRNCSWRT